MFLREFWHLSLIESNMLFVANKFLQDLKISDAPEASTYIQASFFKIYQIERTCLKMQYLKQSNNMDATNALS